MPVTQLPVVDFSALNIDEVQSSELSHLRENGSLISLANELVERLEHFGFCYLKHPGISGRKVDKLLGSLREVFLLPEDRKKAYAKRDDVLIHGYGTVGLERPADVTSVERYETFMTCPDKAFDPSFFRRSHGDGLGELRQTLYHSYPDDFEPNPGQLRFFEHCDIGSIALIYQDTAGGLQVKSKSGDWLDAEVIPDTVILMVGQMLQRWTSDKFRAPLHRVIIPTDRESRRTDRFSMTFFPLTPDEFIFECLDGSNKYRAMTLNECCMDRIKKGEFKEI